VINTATWLVLLVVSDLACTVRNAAAEEVCKHGADLSLELSAALLERLDDAPM
jgi:hypothetical protein